MLKWWLINEKSWTKDMQWQNDKYPTIYSVHLSKLVIGFFLSFYQMSIEIKHFVIFYFAQHMGLKDFLVLFLMAMTSFKFENGGDNRTKGLLSTRQTKAGKVGGFGKPFCCWGSKPEHELRFCSTTAVHLPFNVCSASVATASISFQLTIHRVLEYI